MKKKSEQNYIRDYDDRLNSFDTCEVLVHQVLAFGMDHINNLKLKETRVMLHYHSGSENFKGGPNKVELVEAITDFLINDWEVLVHSRCFCVCMLY